MVTITNDMHDSLGTNYVYESKDEQERFTKFLRWYLLREQEPNQTNCIRSPRENVGIRITLGEEKTRQEKRREI